MVIGRKFHSTDFRANLWYSDKADGPIPIPLGYRCQTMAHPKTKKCLSPGEIPNLFREISENESDGDLSCS
ncbi:hypothetical protein TNCV_1646091 [Trichonephila clavipes]|nr:hypothetical protein TNCV_1646091 [Trichonephila clavipes]